MRALLCATLVTAKHWIHPIHCSIRGKLSSALGCVADVFWFGMDGRRQTDIDGIVVVAKVKVKAK